MAEGDQVEELKRQLVDGLQVLTREGVLDGSGHLSARIPGTETLLISPRYAGVLADPEDLCTVTLAGKRIAGAGPIPLETVIHTAVYRRRPDVGSVLHCHARYAVLLGLQGVGLIPFNREAAGLGPVPVHDESRGISDDTMADAMADTLGDAQALFLRGHGIVVVGPSVASTCVIAARFEKACTDQLLLMSFSTPRALADTSSGGGLSGPRMENPYRAWPFLLEKHGLKSRAEAKALAASGSKRTLRAGEEA